MDNTERKFQEADATVDQAVAAFISKIKSISGKWDDVAPVYIVERALLELCDELTKLIDDPGIADSIGPATLELSNALANYRDSRGVARRF
ncbi:MAG: hypothetical protein E6G79_11175 [Alphaproteobacteria bacterium]|jgi:hypothetical protein|nr:MAG: hypothetical protein E6G82_15600 [Alphaproteobacteria bacterium]TMJ83578.1 MAG: hypothetical protein E6G79_11175 [Alphaproteobacteria bacterium]